MKNNLRSLGMPSDDPAVSIRLATFDQYRGLLFSVAYRMLGSVADAEWTSAKTAFRRFTS